MTQHRQCAGYDNDACPNEATEDVTFVEEKFRLCEKCFKRYDDKSRRLTGKGLREAAAEDVRHLS